MSILLLGNFLLGVMLVFLWRRDGDIGRTEFVLYLFVMFLCLHPHAQRM